MKEYKGYGGNKVTIDGDNILIKQLFQKEKCTFNDIRSVSLVEPKLLKNGSVTINTEKATYEIIFLKKSLDEFKELYNLIYGKIYRQQDGDRNNVGQVHVKKEEISKNANDMYQYCIDHNYGVGKSKGDAIKNFQLIENSLGLDEKVLMCFMGLHNYVSMKSHDSNYAYVLTDKRIIMAQKKGIGENIQTVSLKNLNDITMTTGTVIGIITVDTLKETFNVGVNKTIARRINDKLHNILIDIQDSKTRVESHENRPSQNISAADEILKFKELLDMGAITEEEFNIKKKEILGI